MTDNDRTKWDSRYEKNMGGKEPSLIVKKYRGLACCGHALDIACGSGRNSIFLAENGFVVDAVDISAIATNHLAGRNPKINVICADLDAWEIQQSHYDLIVNIRFMDRRLFPMIEDGLKPRGILIYESFMDATKDKYCLEPNELLRVFQSLHIIYYEEKRTDHSEKFNQTASLVAIKPDPAV